MTEQTQSYTQEKVGRYRFLAEPFHCDFKSELTMGHLGNTLLNAADFHSHDRGFGMIYLNSIHKTWVLSRLCIELERMPKAFEAFHVETWVENAMRFFTNRNFAIIDEEGHAFGYGRSVWAMIDTDTRQPQNLFEVHDGRLQDYIETDKPCPIEKGSRVKLPTDAQWLRTIDTHYNDVDMNGHINSIKYIEHVLDLWPIEWHRQYRIKRFETAYVAEAHPGDQLHFYCTESQPGDFGIRITRTVPGQSRDEEVEVCRCRIVAERSVGE